MKKHFYLGAVFILILVLTITLAGCGGGSSSSSTSSGPSSTSTPPPASGIYVAGFYYNSDNIAHPCYWYQLLATDLLDVNKQLVEGAAYSIVVSDKIYVAGEAGVSTLENNSPCYWENGNQTVLNSSVGSAFSICVSDAIYTCGRIKSSTLLPYYWEGSNVKNLTVGTSTTGDANGICVYENKVYTAGEIMSATLGKYIPCYWVNNTECALESTTEGYAYAICNSGSTLYIGGYYRSGNYYIPCYWEVPESGTPILNNLVVTTTSGTASAYVRSIYFANNKVYCAGYYVASSGIEVPCYWTDTTTKQNDLGGSAGGRAYAICVSGGIVYIAGYYDSAACYWHDGVRVDLNIIKERPGEALSIFVK
jgi:hypothetical protein